MTRPRLYFAYGSNLNVRQMSYRCPTARLIGPATLEGERLVFRGVADIEKAPGRHVPGALWEIDAAALEALDRYEGYPHLYGREIVTVRDASGRRRRALVYRMVRASREMLPSPGYLDTIVDGYRDTGILRQRDILAAAVASAGRALREAGIDSLVVDGKRMRPATREPFRPPSRPRITSGMTRATQLDLGLDEAATRRRTR